MAETESISDPYEKLRKHLDEMPIPFPKTKSGVEIRVLKHIFTPEEAEIASYLSFLPRPAKDLYRTVKKLVSSREDFDQKMESMAKKGGIFRVRRGEDVMYSNAVLAVGIFEYQVNRLSKDFVIDFKEYIEEAFFREGLNSQPNQLRVIPIEQAVPHENFVAPYEDIKRIFEDYSGPISLQDCVCRKSNRVIGKECSFPLERCLALGPGADFYIENGIGKKISKEEAVKVLQKSQEEGLVIQFGNTISPFAICSCCGCCCEMLSNAKKLEKPAEFLSSNYFAVVDSDSCTGCGVCETRCHMDAIKLDDSGKAKVNLNRCIGCGVCVPTCGATAISLQKKTTLKEPPRSLKDLYLQIGIDREKRKNTV